MRQRLVTIGLVASGAWIVLFLLIELVWKKA